MITGIVTREGQPTIVVSVGEQEWSSVIDTGFNGDLELPEWLRPHVNARFRGLVRSLLGGGQQVEEAVYLVDFPFDGEIVLADATFVEGQGILVGTHLMRQYHLDIDFPGQTVRLERLS